MNSTILNAGLYLISKARLQAAQSGITAAAKNLRKQGVPLALAVQILATNKGA